MTLSADEMELYSKVIRQFRTVFLRQEHMNTFKTYDSADINVSSCPLMTELLVIEFIFILMLLLMKDVLLVIYFKQIFCQTLYLLLEHM